MTIEIPLSRPDIGPLEEELVLTALHSGRLSIGPMQEAFEGLVAARANTRHAIAVSSGTAALHLVLRSLGYGPGDEVITTPFSFVASTNAILYCGATPVFVDICPSSLNLDPKKIAAAITPRTKGILAVETFGNPQHFDTYAEIANTHGLQLIEDSCEALGTTLNGQACGSFGKAGVFGFYPNKQICTGEGGMIVTDDDALADSCRSLRNQGRGAPANRGARADQGSWLRHEHLGFNYRLSELSCALGVAQMRRLDELIEGRQRVARMYIDRLMGIPDLVMPTVSEQTAMSWFVFVVRLVAGYEQDDRDRIIHGLRNHEVGAADYFPCIHEQPYIHEAMAGLGLGVPSMPVAETVSQRTIALPFYTGLSEREIELVAQTLELMLKRQDLSRS